MTAPLVAKTPYDVDVVASEIARVAALAKQMPPAWDGAKVAHGFTGTQGENLGRVLPGRGVALASDLKSLGITKPIPYVFEKSLAMKAVEAFGGRERLAIGAASMLLGAKLGVLGMGEAILSLPMLAGAITNYDGIINARANGNGQDVTLFVGNATTSATAWHSLLNAGQRLPGGAFSPATIPGGTAPNRATTGALSAALGNPGGTSKKYLATIGYMSTSTLNVLMLVDVLAASGGVNANINTVQSVGTPTLTRSVGGAGNLVTMEVTTALGATASDFEVSSYTNQSGVSGRAAGISSMVASSIAGRLAGGIANMANPFVRLASGDYGVRSVQSLRFTTAMGAGVLNLYIYKPLHILPGVGGNVYVERDSTVQIDGLTELEVGSDNELGFLGFFVLPAGTSSGSLIPFLRTVEG